QRAVLAVFVIQAVLGAAVVAGMVLLVLFVVALPPLAGLFELPDRSVIARELAAGPLGPAGTIAETGSSAVSLACAVIGVARLRTSRLVAYRWLERSVLVAVFFGQVLLFWHDQLAAVFQLGWNLLLLAGLRYAIRQEDARRL